MKLQLTAIQNVLRRFNKRLMHKESYLLKFIKSH